MQKMDLEQNITNDGEGRRKSRIVLPGTSEYEAGMRRLKEVNRNLNPSESKQDEASRVEPRTIPSGSFNVNDLVSSGQLFYSSNTSQGVALALEEALSEVGEEGIVANMPYLIAGKTQAEKENYLWKNWFTAFSEENVGIDKDGKFVEKGKPVILTVHGGGILTPERIKKAYTDGLTDQKAAKYNSEEFEKLLNGVLPTDESIDIYSIDDVKKNEISNPFGRYAVWCDFEEAKATQSGYHGKADFMKNPLVFARTGATNDLGDYFNKAKGTSGNSKNKVGNWHRLTEIDPNQAQGRVLFLVSNCYGLSGDSDLDNIGRFVGVRAPEAQK